MVGSRATKAVYIVAAKRTPFGTFGGALKSFTATELGAIAGTAALRAASPENLPVSSVVFGNVLQTSSDAAYLARHIGHRVGLENSTPALTINRLCGSGFQAAIQGAQEILLGESDLVLVGGTENMSQAPYVLRNVRWGTKYGPLSLPMEDTLSQALVDQFPVSCPMGLTAENLSKKYGISREQCDEFALLSQSRWDRAQREGLFQSEIEPVTVEVKRGKTIQVDKDEHPRPETTLDSLRSLKPVFSREGVTTAGNASGMNDGASAILLASEQAVSEHSLAPMVRILAWDVIGVDPSIMGIGPVPAIRNLLERCSLALTDVGLVEVNEAFAAQFLAVQKELDLPMECTNVDGGAIAIGHPLAASGARILTHLAHRMLADPGHRYAVGAACIGGGQGIAVLLERA